MPKISIIDYGVGNLLSVQHALDKFAIESELVADPAKVASAEKVILPGVGAFGKAMEEFRGRGLEEPVLEFAKSGKPLLGICVGMQMLFEYSEEFGRTQGLGLLPGGVVAIPASRGEESLRKIPHVGWSALRIQNQGANNLLDGMEATPYVYFVHSFMASPAESGDILADTDYDGVAIPAMVGRNNIWGCQFHPERSGEVGLNVIRNFANL